MFVNGSHPILEASERTTYGDVTKSPVGFLFKWVLVNRTWVAHVNAETKQQSVAWNHTCSPTWLRKACQTLLARRLMITIFWDVQGIFIIEFMTHGTAINSKVYCRMLMKLKRAMQNKHLGLLNTGVVVLHDNVPSHCCRNRRDFSQIQMMCVSTSSLQPRLGPFWSSSVHCNEDMSWRTAFHWWWET